LGKNEKAKKPKLKNNKIDKAKKPFLWEKESHPNRFGGEKIK